MALTRFSPEVESYLNNEAPDTHPAFGLSVESSTCLHEKASQATKDFLAKVQTYSKSSSDILMRDVSAIEHATWADVLQAVADIQAADKSKAQGWKGFLHRGGRKFGAACPSIESCLVILPRDLYSSVLCGGLEMIIKAAARRSQLRDKVRQTLTELPETFEEASQFREKYPDDQQLSEKMLVLYIKMLGVFEGALEFYHQNPGEHFKALWKQDAPTKDFDAKIQAVQEAAKHLRRCSELCLHSKVGDLHSTISNIEAEQRKLSSSMRVGLGTILEDQVTKTEVYKWVCELRRQYALGAPMLLQHTLEQLKPPIQSAELNEILQVPPDTSGRDALAYDNMRLLFDSENAIVDQYIVQSSLFHVWFSSRQSQAIGIPDIFFAEEISPLTIFCATFVCTMRRQPLFLSLSHFCQLHVNDGLVGGSGLIRSLISQLSPHVTLEGLSRQEVLQSSGNISYQMSLFDGLIARLSGCAVFCVIDGIHAFDRTPALASELNLVLMRLVQLASTSHPRLVFKLLVTGIGNTWFFREGLSIYNQLVIEDDYRNSSREYTKELLNAELAS
ncbi:hypothetical protein GJ744_005176 [Endocarpon pusillum]|uniref:DUF7708 domain-containing protein n=1 Tax=Endocarpon pusillum TaxID=364733 RepID=A0A8H7A875_9EURO|nr:hypothetical protein GJ744_005176 [Endocarpon pusillum]